MYIKAMLANDKHILIFLFKLLSLLTLAFILRESTYLNMKTICAKVY
jgi:hypothetical protein